MNIEICICSGFIYRIFEPRPRKHFCSSCVEICISFRVLFFFGIILSKISQSNISGKYAKSGIRPQVIPVDTFAADLMYLAHISRPLWCNFNF